MKTRLSLFLLAFLCLSIFTGQAQCTAAFTYTIYPGDVTMFTSTSTGIDSNTRYTWYFGDGNYLPNVSDTVSYNYHFSGTYHVTLLVSDSSFTGCYDTISQDIVITNPVAPTSFIADFTDTVANGQVTCSMVNSSSGFFNLWQFGDGSSLYDQPNPTHNYNSNGTYVVTCISQAIYMGYNLRINLDTFSQTIQVTNVPCHSQFLADSSSIAGGGLLIHSYAAGADSTFYSVNYGPHIPGNLFMNGIDTLWNVPAGNNVVCQYITGTSCTDSSCQTIYVGCGINESHNVGCGQVTFNMSSNQSITSAAWYIGGTLVSTQASPTITFTNTSSFYISYDLQTSLCQKQDSVLIQVGPSPSFYVVPDSANGPHNWVVWVNNQSNFATYIWSWGDGTSSTGMNPSHTYTVASMYTICLKVIDNCGDSATVCQNDSLYRTSTSMVGVTVQNQNSPNAIIYNSSASLKIYPVPATEYLVIENLPQAGRAELYDNEGRKVASEIVSEKRSQINVQSLAPGFYLMKIYSGNEVWLKKIVKQ